ncbi:MAG: nitrilase-related carbon-nitrogen hydrolase [Candidatus Competibacteraceae bacterium]
MFDSLSEAIVFIHALVEEARQRGSDDYEGPLSLAAHLFAIISSDLLRDHRNPGLFKPSGSVVIRSWQDALDQLKALGSETDAHTLYWMIIRTLQIVEAKFTLVSDGLALPERTELKLPLYGRVYHWLRPVSELAKLRSKRFAEADDSKRPPAPAPRPIDHLKTLGMFWASDLQLPDFRFRLPAKNKRNIIPLVKESGRSAKNGLFKIALCPLLGDFHPLFEIEASGRYFTTCRNSGIHNCASMQEHLTRILEAASQGGAQLLVFPELCIDESMREHIRKWLRDHRNLTLQGIIAGSFHVWKTANSGLPYNETVLLDHKGAALLYHQKRGRFRIRRDQVKSALQFFRHLPDNLDNLKGEIQENILSGKCFQILETALGRLAVVICADVLEADAYGFQQMLERLHPDLLFIISMSNETKEFEDFFQRIAKHGIGTLFVNAACICDPRTSPILAAANLALFEPAGAPPSYLRWLWDESVEDPTKFQVQRYDHRRESWELVEFTEEEGVSWLGDSGGLVINLGVQWRQSKS